MKSSASFFAALEAVFKLRHGGILRYFLTTDENTVNYPSDLTDAQWAVLEPLLILALPKCRRGRRSVKRWRHSLNALLYLGKTGSQWRFLPKEYGNWKTTYSVFWRWRRAGV
jgi:putative transposase